MTSRHSQEDSPTSRPEARYTIQTLLVAVVVTIIVTVLALEMSGRIDHSGDDAGAPIGQFTAAHVKPGADEIRMSPKPSELHGVCEDGFLAIASDADPNFFGILLDYKNRGVRCGPSSRPSAAAPPQSEEAASGSASGESSE
ncbi:MAG: hypothetical protein KGY54_05695 [Oleiphilaceae bacterium]|nr:hypothetical protein [Oleiphilaceae bacterium]